MGAMRTRFLLALLAGGCCAAGLAACSLLVDTGGLSGGGANADAATWGLDGSAPPPHDSGSGDSAAPDGYVSTGLDAAGEAGDLRFYAGTGTGGGIHASTWVHAEGAWTGPALVTVPSNGTVAWIVPALNYDGTEILAVESQFATATGIDVLSGAGSSFTNEISITGLRQATSADHRSFDMALEGLSSDAMLVYSDDSPNPKWRKRVALSPTFWSPEQPVFTTGPGTGAVEWIQLVARPNTNTIALVYSSANDELFVTVWNGTAWSAPTQLAPQTFPSFDGGAFALYSASWQCFGAAYTDPGGDLFVGYSLDMYSVNAGFTWVVEPSGQTSFSTPAPVSNYVPPGPLSIAAEPGTNHIAISYLEQDGTCPCDDFNALVWDGAQIADFTKLDDNYGLSGYAAGASPDGVNWLTSAGAAVAVYAHAGPDGGISGNLGWAKWTAPNGWILQPEAPMQPPLAQLLNARMAALSTGDRVFGFLEDVNGPIWVKSFDGNTWSDTFDGGPLESAPSRTTGVPFAALPR
jgi:hypothetical protein